MIRLLRRRRGPSDSESGESAGAGSMIEPEPLAVDRAASDKGGSDGETDGRYFAEPSLKMVSADNVDGANAEDSAPAFPRFTVRTSADAEDAVSEPIHLEVHNTARAAKAQKRKSAGAEKERRDDGAGETGDARGSATGDDAPGDVDETQDEVRTKGALLHTVPFSETRLAIMEEEPRSNPSFNIFANARIWRHDDRNLNYSGEVAKLYRDVFTPTRPKRSYRDFSGRRDTIEAIIQAVEEERSHVIVLGEKSLGKTSLLNIVADCALEAGYLVARMSGTADMNFEHFIVAILEQFSKRIEESPVKDILQRRLDTANLCDLIDQTKELDVPAAIKIFQRLSEHQAIVLVDDFERIEDPELKTRICEMMSVLSDQGAWLSLLLFGRAARASDILPVAYHSLPNATWVKLLPMDDEDATRVIARGVSAVGVQFGDDVAEAIVRLAQGMPAAIQWLCLLTIRHATQRYASEVEMHDLAEVITSATVKIDAKLSAYYDQICGPARGNWAGDILYLAVQAARDRNGVFSTDEMSRISEEMLGRPLLELPLHSALSRFTGEGDDEPVLEKVGTANGTGYRFVNPAMRSIVMLKNCGRLPNMPEALLEKSRDVELLPSPGARPSVA